MSGKKHVPQAHATNATGCAPYIARRSCRGFKGRPDKHHISSVALACTRWTQTRMKKTANNQLWLVRPEPPMETRSSMEQTDIAMGPLNKEAYSTQ
ncbi:unnamed protein product, partial [Brenthis ino]